MGFTGDFTVGEVGERNRKNIFWELVVEVAALCEITNSEMGSQE